MQLLLRFKGDLTNLPVDFSRVRVATKPASATGDVRKELGNI
jgi:hypothetical protein